MTKIQTAIEKKLRDQLEPLYLQVVNESGNHNVPPGSESHFKVTVVSGSFEGKPAVARHRMVNKLLDHELSHGVHALAIKALTPEQWEASGGKDHAETPPCMHQ